MRTSAWRLVAYAMIVVVGALAAVPNVLTAEQLDALPNWLPKQQMALGLDLRGGAHLLLEIDAKALHEERLLTLMREARDGLRDAKIETQSVRRDGGDVAVVLTDPSKRGEALRVLTGLAAFPGEIEVQGAATLRVHPTDEGKRQRLSEAADQIVEIVRARLDDTGLAEPTIQRAGAQRLVVQLPGVQDTARIEQILRSTAKLSFHMVRAVDPSAVPPPGVMILPGARAGERYAVEESALLTGDRLSDARLGADATTSEPVVTFTLDRVGAQQFAAITTASVGKPFAVVLDGKVLTAPVIEQPIIGGSGQIKGDFTRQSASDLAAQLRAGALPASLNVIEKRTVGADGGQDALEMGLFTGVLGFAAVFAFMVLLYGRWGLVANLALALNVVLTIAALTVLGATLTLPGIAGIVLGIGLAVDANVLINERIREETRKGMSAIAALDAGFRRAFATIVDSNLTALIATVLLFMFGTGPVRGFAVTMGLGIGISMFTAVTVVRVIMQTIVRRRRMKVLAIEPLFGLRLVPDGTTIAFMRARHLGLAVSAVLSIASLALFLVPGPNYGVDFKGGIQFEAATAGQVDLQALRTGLNGLGLGEVTLQAFGGASNVLVRAERQVGGDNAQQRAFETLKAKIAEIAPDAKISNLEIVWPKVSDELAQTGVLAVVLASLAMLAYVWARFEWPFAVGAIATLILDVTKTVGFFVVTGIEFDLTAIAALLTLIGYSVNDKVVVYDRMRENMRRFKSLSLRDIIDRSINETLGRSLYTSITALIALVPMAVWGGSAVESFAVPMVFGIVVAASSSVFIAAPILLFLGDWRRRRSVLRQEAGLAQTAP